MAELAGGDALRVLVVDDDEDQRFLARSLLARAGITDVTEAADGEEALQVAPGLAPSLVLLDLEMPGMSGLDLLPELLRVVPEARVVVVSHLPEERMGSAVRHRGAVGYVEKRVESSRFVAEVLLAARLAAVAADRITSSRFSRDETAPRTARRFVREALDEAGEDVLSSAELLVSELVTNAVVHANSEPQVDVVVTGRTIRVRVGDDDPTLPRHREVDVGSPGGRGLRLLDRVATRWGVEPHDGGKVVWFELER